MRRLIQIVITLTSGLVALLVAGLVVGAWLDPTSGWLAVLGSSVWAPFGPLLLLAVMAALCMGLVARMTGSAFAGTAVLVVAAVGVIGASVILGRIWMAGLVAGAEIDLADTVLLGSMEEPAPDVVETVRTVEGNDLLAALYLPPPSPRPAPVIAYIHGGGFMAGSFTEVAADLRWFADRGWLVMSFEYRLFAPGRPTWDRAPEDVACALVWVSRNASRFGGNVGQIVLLGDSAGGNLAVNVGYAAAAGVAPDACGADVPVPSAIAVLYPALDPLSIYERGFPLPGFQPRMLIEGFIGGSPDRYPQRIAAVSSASFLTSAAPPTLIVLPEKDSLVVAEGTLDFAEAARRVGVDLELVTIPFANHVFNQIAAGSLGNQIGRTIRLRFLAERVD